VNLGIAAAIIAGSAAAMVALMLALRRIAPEGGHFRDSDRASSVLGFLGLGFAIVLGFVVLLAFEGYSNAKTKAETEATAVFEQYELAARFSPAKRRERVQGELVCYARSVINEEWPAMKRGRTSPVAELWLERLEGEVRDRNAGSLEWFEDTDRRDEGRRGRLLEARSVLPTLLWVMLIIGAAAVVAFILLYADPTERPLGQVMFSGGVSALVVVSLLVISLLASPFQNQDGSIKPASMRYSLGLIGREEARLRQPLKPPCDQRGLPASDQPSSHS
jgi:multisubunit Na+/H+ antiporter MnhB subunit